MPFGCARSPRKPAADGSGKAAANVPASPRIQGWRQAGRSTIESLMSERIPAPRTVLPFDASWKTTGAIALIMVLLALLGVGLATMNALLARNYWITLVPIYGVLCTITAWKRSQQAGAAGGRLVLRQVLHWLAIAAAVLLDFAIHGSGVETQLSSGFNALLLLALGCFLAGVHLDWSFSLVGSLLALTLVCAAKAESYLWLLFIAGVLAIGALLAAWRLLGGEGARGQAAP